MQLDANLILSQARAHADNGDHEQARLLLLELLKEQSDNQPALIMLGGDYYEAKMYGEAELVFDRLITMNPGTGEYSIALFNCLWKQGRHQEAAEEIRRFITVADPVAERATLEQYAALSKAIAEQGNTPE